MKEKFSVLVIDNVTGKVIQRFPYYSRAEAQQEYDGWEGTHEYGPDKRHRLEMLDESVAYNQQLEVVDRTDDRGFSLWIIDVIAAYNKKNFSKSQMQTIFSTPGYMAIILGLLTGALETTRDAIAAVGPTLYPQEFVDQILASVDNQLASHVETSEESSSSDPV